VILGPWRTDVECCGRRFRETRFDEFVVAKGELLRGDIHGAPEISSADVLDEGAGSFYVYRCVFAGVGVGLVC